MTAIKSAGILILIFLAGTLLRFHGLGTETFWFDEVTTMTFSQKYSLSELFTGKAVDFANPPLYYALVKIWAWMTGTSEFAVRSLGAGISSINILLIYALGKFLDRKETGILASLLLALNSFHISYAADARSYSLVVCQTLLSVMGYGAALSKNSSRFWILSVFVNLTGCMTHYFFVFVCLFELIYLFVWGKSSKRAVIFLLTPLAAVFLWTQWISKIEPGDILYYSAAEFGMYYIKMFLKFFGAYRVPPHLFVLYPGIAALYLWAVILAFRSVLTNRKMLVFWFLSPLLLSAGIVFYHSLLVPRYLILITPALYILAAAGVSKMRSPLKWFWLAGYILISGFFIGSLKTQALQRGQWDEAASYLKDYAEERDLILVLDGGGSYPLYWYYQTDPCRIYLVATDFETETLAKKSQYPYPCQPEDVLRMSDLTRPNLRIWIGGVSDPKSAKYALIKEKMKLLRRAEFEPTSTWLEFYTNS